MQRNPILAEGGAALALTLHAGASGLRRLGLRSCHVGALGAEHIVKALEEAGTKSHLVELNLQHDHIGERGVRALLALLRARTESTWKASDGKSVRARV